MGFVAATAAYAHFVFAIPDEAGSKVNVIINEELKPSLEVGVGIIEGTKLSLRDAAGAETPLALVKEEHTLTGDLPGEKTGTRLIHGLTDLGESTRGSTKPYRLLYHPKTILGDAFDAKAVVGGDVPVEIVPRGGPGAMTLELVGRGKPVADAEITVILPDGKQQKVKTGRDGRTPVLTQTGRYGAWARFWETDVRHYATLVFDAPNALPHATSSFGAVASDGWLYVYGGHVAPTHNYYKEAVSGRFDRMRLTGDPVWETLPGGPPGQGMNLTVHAGKIYRIGGRTPHNNKGQPADSHSIAGCARFDPATKSWEELPPLPEPRSSHDVVVIDNQLIVVGGWALDGKSKSKWAETLAVMDFSVTPLGWRSAKQPFQRRAFMAASHDGKMYVIGGINESEKIVRDVSITIPGSMRGVTVRRCRREGACVRAGGRGAYGPLVCECFRWHAASAE
jgi:hypothetical protein